MRARTSTILVGAAFCILICSFVALAFFSGHPVGEHLIMDADAFHIPVALNEIFSGEASVSQWSYPSAPGIFPEWIIYALSAAWLPKLRWQLPAYAFGQLLFVGAMVAILARGVGVRKWPYSGAFASIALLSLSLIWPDPLWISWSTAFHFGSFLSALICMTIVVGLVRITQLATMLLLAFLLMCCTALGVMSDAFVIPQTVVPLIFCSAISACTIKSLRRASLSVAVATFLGTFIGLRMYNDLIPNRQRGGITLDLLALPNKLKSPLQYGSGLTDHGPILLLIVLTGYLVMIAWLVTSLRLRDSEVREKAICLLTTLMLVSSLFSILGLLLLPLEVTPRYLITFYLWPVVWTGIMLARFSIKTIGLMFALLATVSAFSISQGLVRNGLDLEYYPESIRCLDENLEGEETHGIASYWDARWFQAYSQRQLTLAPVVGFPIQEFHFNTNEQYFRDTYHYVIAKRAPTLVAMHDVAEGQVVSQFGWPNRTVNCGDRVVMFYDDLRLGKS